MNQDIQSAAINQCLADNYEVPATEAPYQVTYKNSKGWQTSNFLSLADAKNFMLGHHFSGRLAFICYVTI